MKLGLMALVLVAGCSEGSRPDAPPPPEPRAAADAPAVQPAAARPDTPGARPDFSVLPGTGGSGTAPDSSAEVPEPNESHATDLTVHEKPRPVPTR